MGDYGLIGLSILFDDLTINRLTDLVFVKKKQSIIHPNKKVVHCFVTSLNDFYTKILVNTTT